MTRSKKISRLRALHKWPALVLSVFIILYSLSGIVMNHREFFSSIDISRKHLNRDYKYYNWNNAAVRSGLTISGDSALLYGNIGIWLTKDNYHTFSDFNAGFPKGVDNRKIFKVFKSAGGNLYAGTLFGLYYYQNDSQSWRKIDIPLKDKRIIGILQKDSQVLIHNRTELFAFNDNPEQAVFTKLNIPAPINHTKKIGLFQTLWQIHSGEVFGLPGKLFVDLLGIIFIFFAVSGLILFFTPSLIRSWKQKIKIKNQLSKTRQFNRKWHNKLGRWTIIFLLICTFTGMFLRPPFLIFIAHSKVPQIKFTNLDQPNPWFDKLRSIIFDEENRTFLFATSDGFFATDANLIQPLKRFLVEPPFSVMGVNVFEKTTSGEYLVGSFSGLYKWVPEYNYIEDYVTNQPTVGFSGFGPPVGNFAITGYLKDQLSDEFFFDYSIGAYPLKSKSHFVEMPHEIEKSPISLWNFSLEIHTGRFYKSFLGDFYILFIPISGILILTLLIAGYFQWRLMYKSSKSKKNAINSQ